MTFYFEDEYDEDYVGFCDWCDAEVGDEYSAARHNTWLNISFECSLCGWCPYLPDGEEEEEEND